jgi:hypothetical protein
LDLGRRKIKIGFHCIILDEYIKMASFSAGPNGALVATGLPPQKTPAVQNAEGGIIGAATAKSVTSRQEAADAYKNLGGGQKGASRKMRGGSAPAHVPPSTLPTAGSIPGVSHEAVMQKIINNHNQLKADAAYDGLSNARPKLIGGRVKRRRSTKKHGRRRNGTRRRRSRRHSRIRRRSRRTI